MSKKKIILIIISSIPTAIFALYLLVVGAVFVFTNHNITSFEQICAALILGVVCSFIIMPATFMEDNIS
jgi:hypothetical protein